MAQAPGMRLEAKEKSETLKTEKLKKCVGH